MARSGQGSTRTAVIHELHSTRARPRLQARLCQQQQRASKLEGAREAARSAVLLATAVAAPWRLFVRQAGDCVLLCVCVWWRHSGTTLIFQYDDIRRRHAAGQSLASLEIYQIGRISAAQRLVLCARLRLTRGGRMLAAGEFRVQTCWYKVTKVAVAQMVGSSDGTCQFATAKRRARLPRPPRPDDESRTSSRSRLSVRCAHSAQTSDISSQNDGRSPLRLAAAAAASAAALPRSN